MLSNVFEGCARTSHQVQEGKRQLALLNTPSYLLLLAEPELLISSVRVSVSACCLCASLRRHVVVPCVSVDSCMPVGVCLVCACPLACLVCMPGFSLRLPACPTRALLRCVPACLPVLCWLRGLAEPTSLRVHCEHLLARLPARGHLRCARVGLHTWPRAGTRGALSVVGLAAF